MTFYYLLLGGNQGGNLAAVPEICTDLVNYPDPEDKYSYYHCVELQKKPEHITCDWGQIFDPKKLKCVCGFWWC